MIKYTIIEVPDMNDSTSRVVLNGKQYILRFTYIDSGDYWVFSVYDAQNEPVAIGIKIVPGFPLNVFLCVDDFPEGVFQVLGKLSRVGRNDFKDGNAKFIFAPMVQE